MHGYVLAVRRASPTEPRNKQSAQHFPCTDAMACDGFFAGQGIRGMAKENKSKHKKNKTAKAQPQQAPHAKVIARPVAQQS